MRRRNLFHKSCWPTLGCKTVTVSPSLSAALGVWHCAKQSHHARPVLESQRCGAGQILCQSVFWIHI
jgi:hypothetical protein